MFVETKEGRAEVSFTIEAALNPDENFQGIDADDVIYLIMIDRFSDGDSTNNAPPDAPREANDRQNPRAFHGGDLRGGGQRAVHRRQGNPRRALPG